MMFTSIGRSWTELKEHFVFARLFREDKDVEGNAWFAQWESYGGLHIFANSLRIFFIIVFSPFYALTPRSVLNAISNYFHSSWALEYARTPPAVLYSSPGLPNTPGRYDVSHERPAWMIEVTFQNGIGTPRQVPWNSTIWNNRYTSLSYSFDSTKQLYKEANNNVLPPRPARDPTAPHTKQRRFTNEDRKRIAHTLLEKYVAARLENGANGVEYVWLDEFCLSDPKAPDDIADQQRKKELGRLADIFRGSYEVVVFCHIEGCEHTDLECPWGKRLFTLAEVVHASHIVKMTRKRIRYGQEFEYTLHPQSEGRFFRERIQAEAIAAKRWHLYAIMQHASNSGTVTWQTAIHAFIVEAILRDQAGGFVNHKFLGKALNGLLPRRAALEDLPGNDGWADLAWLLELNQGFYNAASLAAVCSLTDIAGREKTDAESQDGEVEFDPRRLTTTRADTNFSGDTRVPPEKDISRDSAVALDLEDEASDKVPGHYWLGPPIRPREGNERLEPLVTAFPIPDALNIINAETIGLRPHLKRDVAGLYNNLELHGLKMVATVTLFIFFILGFILLAVSPIAAGVLIYLGFIQFACADLVGGSMYLARSGWILLDNAKWIDSPLGSNTRTLTTWLGRRDNHLLNLENWGTRQLAPEWEPPKRRGTHHATLVDLKSRVFINTVVLDQPYPNAVVPLAVHGCGITCLLVHRLTTTAYKVGMVNMPPYILVQSKKSAAIELKAYDGLLS